MTDSPAPAPIPAIVLVRTTVDDAEVAAGIGRAAVEARLAACAQVGGPVRSVYRWQGASEDATEWTLDLKTTISRYPSLERHLRERHPYDLPEIVATIASAVSPEYAAWVAAETTAADS